MTNAVLISAEDTVVTVIAAVSKGELVTYRTGASELSLCAAGDIPRYHKLAICAVKRGGPVLKYGERIGVATADIVPGEHVHTQNMDSSL